MHEQNESQPKAFIKILFALFTALLVVVLGYLCIQIYTIFHRTYKTETAIAYTMSDNITLKGVAVFQAVDVPGSGNLGYVVQDGERVSAGTILAEQYTDDSQGAMRERLDRLSDETKYPLVSASIVCRPFSWAAMPSRSACRLASTSPKPAAWPVLICSLFCASKKSSAAS